MKRFTVILFCLFLLSCKKEVPEPDVVKMDIYASHIKHTNYNEPNVLYWYVRKANKGGYFYISTTKDVKDFSDYNFNHSENLPNDIQGKSPVKEVVVWINQLNGDLLFDITGKTDYPNTEE